MLHLRPSSVRRTAWYAAAVLTSAALLAAPAAADTQEPGAQAAADRGKREQPRSKHAKRCKKPKVAVKRNGRVRCMRKPAKKPAQPPTQLAPPAGETSPAPQQSAPIDAPASAPPSGEQSRTERARDYLAEYFANNPCGASLCILSWHAVIYECSQNQQAAWGWWYFCNFDMVDNGDGYSRGVGTAWYQWIWTDQGWKAQAYYWCRAGTCEYL